MICNSVNDDEFCKPRQLGIDAINRASNERNDNVSVKLGDSVHKSCRKNYINWWFIKASKSKDKEGSTHCTRSSSTFDFKKNCFICGCPITAREVQQKLASNVESRYREIDQTLIAEISNRGYDEWAQARSQTFHQEYA